jgi:murein L,D-transpeptidase YcbB/YkuD
MDKKIEMELRLGRLYLDYMNHLLYGGIDWKSFDKKRAELAKSYDSVVGWEYYRVKMTPASLLGEATVGSDLKAVFKKAEPKRFRYKQLKKYLHRYLELAENGGWEKLPAFKPIKAGQSSKVIPSIRRHLAMEGDLGACRGDMQSEVYNECLQEAVKRFKLRHGLKGTSVIDGETRSVLNIPIEEKIRKLRLNLDRIKWLWREEAKVRIELNIAAFRLYFYDGKHLVDTMRVIVGKPDHPTPSFHDIMEYIIVNPYWKIPESIVKKEMLGHLMRDPYYYERRGKILRSSWDENSPRVNPGSVNWAKYRGKKPIPYYFMQLPSSRNALGKIKFLFPNKFSVYIHDTPTKKLFFNNQRTFSHGCMRIQKPRELLKALSLYNDNIHVEEIMSLLTTIRKKTIALKTKVPVDIVYLTAFVDDYGYLNFRNDAYGYDKYQLAHYAYPPVKLKSRQEMYLSEKRIEKSRKTRNVIRSNEPSKQAETEKTGKETKRKEDTTLPQKQEVLKKPDTNSTANKKSKSEKAVSSSPVSTELSAKDKPDIKNPEERSIKKAVQSVEIAEKNSTILPKKKMTQENSEIIKIELSPDSNDKNGTAKTENLKTRNPLACFRDYFFNRNLCFLYKQSTGEI